MLIAADVVKTMAVATPVGASATSGIQATAGMTENAGIITTPTAARTLTSEWSTAASRHLQQQGHKSCKDASSRQQQYRH